MGERRRRSGTENRKRQTMVATRMSKEELALIKSAADAKGVTVSRWMRESALTAAAS